MPSENLNININAKNRAGPAIGQARQQVRSLKMQADQASGALGRAGSAIGGAAGGRVGQGGAIMAALAGGPIGIALLGAAAGFAGVTYLMERNAEEERKRIEQQKAMIEQERRDRERGRQAARSKADKARGAAAAINEAAIAGTPLSAEELAAADFDVASSLSAATDAYRGGLSAAGIRAAMDAATATGRPFTEAIAIAKRLGRRATVETIATELLGYRQNAQGRASAAAEIEARRRQRFTQMTPENMLQVFAARSVEAQQGQRGEQQRQLLDIISSGGIGVIANMTNAEELEIERKNNEMIKEVIANRERLIESMTNQSQNSGSQR